MAAGFEDFEIVWRGNVFEGAARPSEDVKRFGTLGVNYRARKPG